MYVRAYHEVTERIVSCVGTPLYKFIKLVFFLPQLFFVMFMFGSEINM